MAATPLPDLVLYERDGCHLCEQTLELVTALLAARVSAGRPVPALVRRDIDSDPAWQRAFFETIPVLELGAERQELAIGLPRVRGFIDTVLATDRWTPAPTDTTSEAPGR